MTQRTERYDATVAVLQKAFEVLDAERELLDTVYSAGKAEIAPKVLEHIRHLCSIIDEAGREAPDLTTISSDCLSERNS